MPKKILSNLEGYKLYRHTSPSGKVYIGITKTSVYARWMCGRGYRRNCHVFHRAILKYGWDNIKHEILFTNLTEERAKKLEIELIRHYKGLNLSYNISDGGNLASSSGYSRKRSSETMKKLWRERPQDMRNHGRKGQEVSIETIRKRSKPVVQFDLEGNYITEYLSVTEASNATDIKNKSIIHCCTGGYFCKTRDKFINVKQAGGYIWKYKEDLICH